MIRTQQILDEEPLEDEDASLDKQEDALNLSAEKAGPEEEEKFENSMSPLKLEMDQLPDLQNMGPAVSRNRVPGNERDGLKNTTSTIALPVNEERVVHETLLTQSVRVSYHTKHLITCNTKPNNNVLASSQLMMISGNKSSDQNNLLSTEVNIVAMPQTTSLSKQHYNHSAKPAHTRLHRMSPKAIPSIFTYQDEDSDVDVAI